MGSKHEREEALRDPSHQVGQRFREASLQAHLAFQGGEHRLDHQPDRGFVLLALGTLGELVLGLGDQLDVGQLHQLQVLAAPEPAVSEQDCAGPSGRELQDAVAFLTSLEADEVIAGWDSTVP